MDLVTLAEWSWGSVAISASVVGFLFVCVLLILTVLIQRPQGGGLAGAFGSAAGSGQTAFGAKTGDALTIFTIAMFVVYLLAAVGLNYVAKPGVEVPATAQASQQPASDKSAPASDQSPPPAGTIPIKATSSDGTPVKVDPLAPPQLGNQPPVAPAPTPGQEAPSATPPAAPATPTQGVNGGDKPVEPKPSDPKADQPK